MEQKLIDRLINKLIGKLNKKSILLLSLMSCSLCLLLNSLLSPFVAESVEYQNANAELFSYSFWMILGITCFVTPVFEEFIFRGTIYEMIKRFINFIGKLVKIKLDALAILVAAMVSCITFGYAHSNPIQFIFGFVFSIFLCIGYESQDTLSAPILMHMVSNVFSAILGLLPTIPISILIAMNIIAVVILIVCCIMFRKVVQENEKQTETIAVVSE